MSICDTKVDHFSPDAEVGGEREWFFLYCIKKKKTPRFYVVSDFY